LLFLSLSLCVISLNANNVSKYVPFIYYHIFLLKKGYFCTYIRILKTNTKNTHSLSHFSFAFFLLQSKHIYFFRLFRLFRNAHYLRQPAQSLQQQRKRKDCPSVV